MKESRRKKTGRSNSRPRRSGAGGFNRISVSRRIRRRLLLWGFVLAVGAVSAQVHPKLARFGRLGVGDGLSQGSVLDVVQDARGFIWLATKNGLNRYDGYQVAVFKHDAREPRSLQDNMVVDLLVDRTGRLWAATGGGLSWRDPDRPWFERFSPEEGAGAAPIRPSVMEEGPDGSLWVGASPAALWRIDQARRSAVRRPLPAYEPGRQEEAVTALRWDARQNKLWIGGEAGGMFVFDPQRDEIEPFYRPKTPLGRHGVESLWIDAGGFLWVALRGAGVLRFGPDRLDADHFRHDPKDPTSLAGDRVLDIFETRDGSLWFATEGAGLCERSPGRDGFVNFKRNPGDPSGLSDNIVFCLFEDRGGVLWIGTNNGAGKLKPSARAFQAYRHIPGVESLGHSRVKAILQSRDRALWVGLYGGGLDRIDLDSGRIDHYRHDPGNPASLSGDNIFALYQGPGSDGVWAGSFGDGLNYIDPVAETVERVAPDDGQGGVVMDLEGDPGGDIWIAAWSRLYRFSPRDRRFTAIGLGPGGSVDLRRQLARDLALGRDGSLWVGSYNAGLFRYRPDSGERRQYVYNPRDPASLSGNRIAVVCEDSRGRLWIGADGSGLNLMNRETETFVRYGVRDGLPDESVYGILEDDAGFLWLSGNRGLCKLDPESGRIVSFDVTDGLQGREFSSGAYCKLAGGLLAFGGVNGLNVFDPRKAALNSHAPPVVLTSFKKMDREVLFERDIAAIDRIELSHRDDVVAFEFAALDFANPGRNRYAFRLKGFDKAWRLSGDRRSVAYTNLDPGRYELQVKGSNDDGVWNEDGVRVEIEVTPPFYRQWWIYPLAALLAFVLLYLRDWRSKRVRRRLERTAAERAQSLQDSNARLEQTAASLRKTQRRLLESAHKAGMAEFAADVLHNIGNGLNSVLVSSNLVEQKVNALELDFIDRLCGLLARHQDNMAEFLTCDARGVKVVEALRAFVVRFERGRSQAVEEIRSLNEQVLAIAGAMSSQKKYAFDDQYFEEMDVRNIMEDVLRIQDAIIEEFNIKVRLTARETPMVMGPKAKLLNVFNHLVKRGCEALRVGRAREERELRIHIGLKDRDAIRVSVRDNGRGIDASVLGRVFSQGRAGDSGGLSAGLHYCAIAMTEMGGRIIAESDGVSQGAVFFVDIPLTAQRPENAN